MASFKNICQQKASEILQLSSNDNSPTAPIIDVFKTPLSICDEAFYENGKQQKAYNYFCINIPPYTFIGS